MFNNLQNQRRTNESPMDWEWQTSGPVDPKSPFPQGQKRGFESTHSISSFAAAASSTPAPPFRNPSFTTPRKPFDQDLFSEVSGAESSPADNADGEDTPDPQRTVTTMGTIASGPADKKPIFGRYGAGFLGSSPGWAEKRRGKYGNQIAHKVRKRQRIERDYALSRGHRGGSDSESEVEEPRSSRSRNHHSKSEPTQHWFSALLNGIESRPNLPNILSYYAQLSLNFFLAGITMYGIWTFWVTIRSDVDKASEDAAALVMAEIAKCAKDYVDNKCGKDVRLPALEAVCDSWEHCMNRDPNSIGRARVSARTFAEIFNSFIEPISIKAMVFAVLIITLSIIVNNLAFGMFRSKTTHHMPPAAPFYAPPTPQHFQWGPPQTPSHAVGYDVYGGHQVGFQAIMPSAPLESRSPSKGSRSPSKGNRSPSKGDRERW